MKKIVVGADIDGCLASFEAGYAPLLEQVSGGRVTFPKLGEEGWPTTWNWERAAGITPEEEKEAWRQIHTDIHFWRSLPAYPNTAEFLEDVFSWAYGGGGSEWGNRDVYFITHRSGRDAKMQTEDWLLGHGWSDNPTVLLTGNKSGACNVLGVTHYIDDKVENCEAVRDGCKDTTCYMLAQPWNYPIRGIPRLPTLETFLEVLCQTP